MSKTAEATSPSEASFYNPAFRQQDKALLSLGELDHDKFNAMICGHLFWDITSVALVNERNLDRIAYDFLDLFG